MPVGYCVLNPSAKPYSLFPDSASTAIVLQYPFLVTIVFLPLPANTFVISTPAISYEFVNLNDHLLYLQLIMPDLPFCYEFGIETEIDTNDEIQITRAVIDLRQIAVFTEIKNIVGPYNKIYKSITHITLKSGQHFAIYYPYIEFIKLFCKAMNTDIQSLPYPE